MSELFAKMAESLIAGNMDEVVSMTKEAIDGGSPPQDILEQGLLAGMDVVGQRFKASEMFIPEVLRCAKCMHCYGDFAAFVSGNRSQYDWDLGPRYRERRSA
jgi:5-methyltetrahydrofolate--homocysteine methyltransferase